MKLDRIKLKHFRCFEDFEMEFAEKVTVLFGRNGVGKTSLIHAISKALSFMFYNDSKMKDIEPLNAGNPKIAVEGFKKDTDGMVNPETNNIFKDLLIGATGHCFGEAFTWSHGVSSSSYRYQPTLFKDAYIQLMNLVAEKNFYPLIAYYSDGFPHIEDDKKVSEKIASLRNFGYHQWNEETACSKIWLERFERTWKTMERTERTMKEGKVSNMEAVKEMYEKAKNEIEAIQRCLVEFSSDDPDMAVEQLSLGSFDDRLVITTVSGNTYSFRKLPAGYKRLFYMILDLAYRSYILNGNTEARGVVIIDEIDLHLHPTLEQSVLSRLTRTFPNTQFIVSTHSPLVITNINMEGGKNRIYRMNPVGTPPTPISDVYGLDYNTGLEDVMGVEARNADIDNMIEACSFMIKMGESEKADKLKELLLTKYHLSVAEIEKRITDNINRMGDAIH
ncbi:AAA family ATPase [Bacteroides cellulosilyticus]|uniref:AAA family ATPase n=1 Tax=Bacteroides cellulosilyticus TaxID=246787 RepID=UPI0032EB919E